MNTFNCYIDESGDEGLDAKSKPWFVLAALVVSQDEEKLVRGFENECKQEVWIANGHNNPPAQLHFRDLRHSQKVGVSRVLNQKPFMTSVVAIRKPLIDKQSGLRHYQRFYFYATRLLLERVSWYVGDRQGHVKIVFSNRRQFPADDLRNYLSLLKGRSDCRIRDVFSPKNDIDVLNHFQDEMLRAADVCAGSFACGLNPDEYAVINPHYGNELFTHLYRYWNRVWRYGFKVFPNCTIADLITPHPHIELWLK